MLVSSSDLSPSPSSNSSQSTRPPDECFWKNYSYFLDFTRSYELMIGIFVLWTPLLISLLASHIFCQLLINFSNSLHLFQTANSFASVDNVGVIEESPYLVHNLWWLATWIHDNWSAVPFYTPTKPLLHQTLDNKLLCSLNYKYILFKNKRWNFIFGGTRKYLVWMSWVQFKVNLTPFRCCLIST